MTEPSMLTLGRYTIHAELGRGGFATVYRATDTVLERDVALKVLKPGWTDDAKAVERFMREAKQASRLKHPSIVTIYDVGQAEGRLFIAMELVRGRSLQQIIAADGAMAWSRVLAILEQSAAALDYAHKQSLVHRDIKPANIILDESEPGSTVHVMLTDFGLVRGAEQASLSMGTTGGLLGTPEYIAPEIWDGEPATKASDVYALGCVAFYLLTGQVLFSATTPIAVLKRHAEGPVFPQHWPSGVPAGVEAVLRRAMAKDPNQRPASAAELVADLGACAEQARREQAATEQEARQKEEAERAAQALLAAEAARRAEEERARQEAERQAKEEAEREAREEQERQRQAELAAQTAAAEKAKRETEERERQRHGAETAALEKSRREAAERERQQQAAAKSVPQVKSNRKWLYAAGGVIAVLAIVIVLASIKPAPPASTPAPTVIDKVGIVLPTKDEPRWVQDEVRFKDALSKAGYDVPILFSQGDVAKEKANVEALLSQGIKVLIICPQDATAAAAAAEEAKAAGVKVISYDRLIRDTDAVDYYVTFDGVGVGEAWGQYLIGQAKGQGNNLYLYAGAPADNNAFLFFEGAWNKLQPKIADGTFVIKNSSEAVALKDKAKLTRDEMAGIIAQVTTEWNFDVAKNLAEANLMAASAADKGTVYIAAPNDGTARSIADAFAADKDVTKYYITGQDAEQASIQYIIDGKQSMTVLKDVRTLVDDAITAALAYLKGGNPDQTTTYNNGAVDVPAKPTAIVTVTKDKVKQAIIDSGYYPASDFSGLP
jgi:putative multiple sugar transport system substrate-binding protein